MKLLGSDYLKIYLEDHYAGATAGVDLAKRIAGQNQGSAYGDELGRLAAEIEEDRDTLRRLMGELGVGPNRLKNTGAWMGEKAGRLKLNGHLTSYSPQSRVVELEGLVLGVTGKLLLWRALRDAADLIPGVSPQEMDALAVRAEAQRERLEGLRVQAVREAVAASDRA